MTTRTLDGDATWRTRHHPQSDEFESRDSRLSHRPTRRHTDTTHACQQRRAPSIARRHLHPLSLCTAVVILVTLACLTPSARLGASGPTAPSLAGAGGGESSPVAWTLLSADASEVTKQVTSNANVTPLPRVLHSMSAVSTTDASDVASLLTLLEVQAGLIANLTQRMQHAEQTNYQIVLTLNIQIASLQSSVRQSSSSAFSQQLTDLSARVSALESLTGTSALVQSVNELRALNDTSVINERISAIDTSLVALSQRVTDVNNSLSSVDQLVSDALDLAGSTPLVTIVRNTNTTVASLANLGGLSPLVTVVRAINVTVDALGQLHGSTPLVQAVAGLVTETAELEELVTALSDLGGSSTLVTAVRSLNITTDAIVKLQGSTSLVKAVLALVAESAMLNSTVSDLSTLVGSSALVVGVASASTQTAALAQTTAGLQGNLTTLSNLSGTSSLVSAVLALSAASSTTSALVTSLRSSRPFFMGIVSAEQTLAVGAIVFGESTQTANSSHVFSWASSNTSLTLVGSRATDVDAGQTRHFLLTTTILSVRMNYAYFSYDIENTACTGVVQWMFAAETGTYSGSQSTAATCIVSVAPTKNFTAMLLISNIATGSGSIGMHTQLTAALL